MIEDDEARQKFALRLASACDKKGLKEHGRGIVLAETLSVSQSAVTKWLNGDAIPRIGKMTILARYLDVPVQWLHFGMGHMNGDEVALEKPPLRELEEDELVVTGYPLISSVRAGKWDEEQIPQPDFKRLYTSHKVSKKSFWLKVDGESMVSSSGPSFPKGTYILVDPEVKPSQDCFIIAKRLSSRAATFRRYIEDSGVRYLRPLNPNWPTQFEEFDGEYGIIGVVVELRLMLTNQNNTPNTQTTPT